MRALELIKAWDWHSSEDSAAYTYIYFWGKAYQDLYSESDLFSRFIGYSRKQININSLEEQVLARRALEVAVTRIQKNFGKTEVPWGEVNLAMRGGTFPMDGTGLYDVLHPDAGSAQDNGLIYSNDGWGHMMVVMEGTPKEIWSLLPYGESEHTSSLHYNDQAKLHSQRQLKRFWFSPAEIRAHTESVRGSPNRISSLLSAR
jgi:acyl-homoserine lactone acylase PvdQ